MTPVEIRNMNNDELLKLLEEKKRTLMNLRFQNAIGELRDFSLIEKAKRDIA
ncbi:MAG TPA: 50S ribosomal protein L29, partial [Fervidobacterium sp.]|nr:50S ribosomal protein L29 [Fervidobacterium sp.]